MLSVYSCDYVGNVKPIEQCPIASPVAADWDLVAYDQAQDQANNGPDLIIHRDNHLSRFYPACRDYRRRWAFTPFILGVTSESYNPFANLVDYTFSYQPDSSSNYYYPSVTLLIPYNLFHHNGVMAELTSSNLPFRVALRLKQADLQDEMSVIKNSFPKQRFCNFIASHADQNFKGTILRRDFVKQLLAYKQVDCAGSVLNNTDELQRESLRGSWQNNKTNWVRGKLLYIAQHRFTIAFENKSQLSYITEKIVHALLVGSIPIYWGALNIAEFFNPDCFINCHDYDSFAAVIEHIKQIEADPSLYAQYLNAPKVLPDSRLYDSSIDKVQAKMNDVMQQVVAHKTTRHRQYWSDNIAYRLQHLNLEAQAAKRALYTLNIPPAIKAVLKRYAIPKR